MGTVGETLETFKQPEYTGENRCLPCTAVNTVLAGVLSIGVGVGLAMMASPAAWAGGAALVFAVSLAAIYFRGYLVPGTPELTKRYFPPWLLELFGKDEPEPAIHAIDPESELVTAGALEECADRDDLCLTDAFQERWYDEIDRIKREGTNRQHLLDLLEIDEEAVEFREHGSAFQAYIGNEPVGKWESEPAFIADLGAAKALTEFHPDWDLLSIQAKSQLLNGLRLFITTCPACGGQPDFGTDTVESCCSTHEVAAVSCGDCDARLFETPVA